MKSAASYFSVSLPLIKENLRRYWAIPVMSFIAYFLSGIFPILIAYADLDESWDFINSLLDNHHQIFMTVHLILPIFTGVLVFRYLQTPAYTTSLHAMPFTRATLFNSTALSGLILSTIPVLLTGIILLLISKPVYNVHIFPSPEPYVNAFTRGDILSWILESLIIVLFLYAVTVFAGLVTGNSIMHAFTAVGFNFLAPALFLLFGVYSYQFLYGFPSDRFMEPVLALAALSPYLFVFYDEWTYAWLLQTVYVLIAVALLGASMYLYYKRALERASDSFVFAFMTPLATFLITLFGMTLFGFYFDSLGNTGGSSESYIYTGFLAGAIIFFLLARMIVKMTFRIFDRDTAKNLGIYLVIAGVFVGTFTLDLTGYEKRMPQEKSIDSAAVSMDIYYLNNPRFFSTDRLFNSGPPALATGENILAIREFHNKAIIDRLSAEAQITSNFLMEVRVDYDLNGAFDMHRGYTMDYKTLRDNKELALIFESEEYKSNYSFLNYDLKKLSLIQVTNNLSTVTITGRSNMEELLACYDRDFQAQKYSAAVSLRPPYAQLNVTIDSEPTPYFTIPKSFSNTIPKSFSNTIAWLRNNSDMESIEITPDKIYKILVNRVVEHTVFGITHGGYNYYQPDEYETKTIEITDKEQIAAILDTVETVSYDYNDFCWVNIIIEPEIAKEYSRYSESQYYYNADTMPDFIRELLEQDI